MALRKYVSTLRK